MPFVLPSDPSPGNVAPASWGDAVRAGLNFLANPPACLAYHSAGQNLTDSAATTLSANSEVYDTDSMHSTSVNPSRLTINTAGLYVFGAEIALAAAADYQLIFVTILQNGGAIATNTYGTIAAGPFANVFQVWGTRKFTAGQYLEVNAGQNNSSNAARSCDLRWFAATWIGLG